MKRHFAPLLAALATSLLMASCGNDKPATTETAASNVNPADSLAALAGDSARMAKPGGVMVDGVAMTADKDIVDNASAAKSVSTLVSAVKQAGLVETLKGAGPFTVFAPTNAAFDKLPKGALAGLMDPASKENLKGVLTYHVIPGRLVAADLKDGQELTTVNGEKLHISVKDGKVMVSNGKDAPATVQIADVISSNGVTHVIDGVVLPLAK
ncbi:MULTISPECIES: fasciclin domain-containing protein [Hymenobacter]|uniref:Fasciclin domain-containing protein n=1 Tax=Hymenobacter armeniacus TaxID=2771358 RepID=A0ABR8JLL2_9BACT|nr:MULTISPECIES: fasciclin domain-containing protein [Hymenobacter]MBD2720877.1 fasciclin domain-containing protein [Hymenobacter armeniacus]MBJ6109798.1 fasciclin domain-containing protein [Hymenobacter sp. BT523]